jgi:cation:H+ antiporter
MAYIGLAMMLMILRLAEIRALWRGVRVTQS